MSDQTLILWLLGSISVFLLILIFLVWELGRIVQAWMVELTDGDRSTRWLRIREWNR